MDRVKKLESEKIEQFFFTNLLKISIVGVSIILSVDIIFYFDDKLSIAIDCVILTACLSSYLLRKRYQTFSVILLTSIITAAMFYQCMVVPVNTTTSLSILLIVCFMVSVLLSGKWFWFMHSVIFFLLNIIFALQYYDLQLRAGKLGSEVVTIAVTYSTLYGILSFTTSVLKQRYDQIRYELIGLISELQHKTSLIEAQNEELLVAHEALSKSNVSLERTVHERGLKLQESTEKLIKYSWVNAHQLRAPVARLLGLVLVRQMERNPDDKFFFDEVRNQALEIDQVVKRINMELDSTDELEA